MWLQVLDSSRQPIKQLSDKRLGLLQLQHHKLALALATDLQKCVACHVLQQVHPVYQEVCDAHATHVRTR